MRILIVDSCAEYVKNLEQTVREACPNALIDVESDEDEACYLVERKEYSVVLTETKRNNFDGLRFARNVRERSPQTRVIFVTNDPSFAVPAFKTRAEFCKFPASFRGVFPFAAYLYRTFRPFQAKFCPMEYRKNAILFLKNNPRTPYSKKPPFTVPCSNFSARAQGVLSAVRAALDIKSSFAHPTQG